MKPRRAVLLLRISDDKSGDLAGVGRQEGDGRHLAERLGWTIGPDDTHVIIENDTSAFKRRKIRLPDGTTALRTVRPGFRRCLDMLTEGAADGLLAYDLDRVARDPRDLEDLIDVVESRHPRIQVESVSGSLRLANDADVTMARVMVAVANKSSRDTSRRVSRKHEQLAEEGRTGGGGIRPFGYERDGMTVREEEAAAIRDMAAMMLNGGTLAGIAAALNERGVKPVRGEKWGNRSVWSCLTGPRIAGLRRFRGEIVGEAAWPAILDRDVWEAVRAKISDRARGTSNQFTRWLTGALWCSLCSHGMTGVSGGQKHPQRYWCNSGRGGCGKMVIVAGHAEAEIEKRFIEFLSDPKLVDGLLSITVNGAAEEARTQLAEDEAQLKELARMWASKHITLPEYSEARKLISQRMQDTKAFALGPAPRILKQFMEGDIGENWDRLEPVDRRAVLLALIPQGFEVLPRPYHRVFDPTRIQLREIKER